MAKFKFDDKELRFVFEEVLDEKVLSAIEMIYRTEASVISQQMKVERPWTDRSNLAKQSLSASFTKPNGTLYRITLAHGVNYGIWLELANEKKYAIIGPTVRKQNPILMQKLKNLFGKI